MLRAASLSRRLSALEQDCRGRVPDWVRCCFVSMFPEFKEMGIIKFKLIDENANRRSE